MRLAVAHRIDRFYSKQITVYRTCDESMRKLIFDVRMRAGRRPYSYHACVVSQQQRRHSGRIAVVRHPIEVRRARSAPECAGRPHHGRGSATGAQRGGRGA